MRISPQKRHQLSLLISLLVGIQASQRLNPSSNAPPACSKNCLCCELQTCQFCYNSVKVKVGIENGCSDQLPGNNCAIYNLENCWLCRSGYSVRGQKFGQECLARTNVPNCLSGYVLGGKQYCWICNNGFYPSSTGEKCLPPSRVIRPIGNCLWGASTGDPESPHFCVKCGKGFVVKSGDQDVCVRRGQLGFDDTGCLVASDSPLFELRGDRGSLKGYGKDRTGEKGSKRRVGDQGGQFYCGLCDGEAGYFQVGNSSPCKRVPQSRGQ